MPDIITDLVTITDAESITGWSGDTFTLEPDIKIQGSNSVAVIQTANGTNTVTYTGGPWNMSGKHLRCYMNSNIMPNTRTKALDGIQIKITSSAGIGYFTVGGSDTYSGGWVDFFIDIDSPPTSGVINSSSITAVSIEINTSSKPRNSTNGWYDYWRFGNGLTINSITTEAFSFQDIANEDILPANAWDILQETDGVLFGKGEIILGDTGAKNCNLISINETLYFVDRVVSTALYNITIQQGTGLTDIDIDGLTCKTVGDSGAELNFSTVVNSLSLKNSSFSKMGAMNFGFGIYESNKFTDCGVTTVTNSIILDSCTFDKSDQIILNNSFLTSCIIKNSNAAAAVVAADLSTITDCTFISGASGHAIEISEGTPVNNTLINLNFSGYGGDGTANSAINYTGTTPITIAYSGGNKPTVTGNVTVIDATYTLTLSAIIENSEVTIVRESDDTVLFNLENVPPSGLAQYTYPHAGDINVYINIHSQEFESITLENETLTANDRSIVINQITDRIYNNP